MLTAPTPWALWGGGLPSPKVGEAAEWWWGMPPQIQCGVGARWYASTGSPSRHYQALPEQGHVPHHHWYEAQSLKSPAASGAEEFWPSRSRGWETRSMAGGPSCAGVREEHGG